jgi:hypothetical protein
MAKQYRVHAYNVGPRVGDPDGDDAHRHMDVMTADGWTVHTATVQYPEVSVLWERELAEEEAEAEEPEAKETKDTSASKAKSSTPARGRRSGAPSG